MASRMDSIFKGDLDWQHPNNKFLTRDDLKYLQKLSGMASGSKMLQIERDRFTSAVGGTNNRVVSLALDKVWAKVTPESFSCFTKA